MATYVIGDLQGCFTPLLRLLEKLKFDPVFDRLWFAGDLVSRGPQSLQTLRFAKMMEHSSVSVLGNHDVSLIAAAFDIIPLHKSLHKLRRAPDFAELIEWLRHRPLLHYDESLETVMVHAGIAPAWDLATARQCAREVEQQLQANDPVPWLETIYGNEPSHWNPHGSALERHRFTVNALTRMRYCRSDGSLEFKHKSCPTEVSHSHPGLYPWFRHPKRQKITQTICFGHWSTLGYHQESNVIALDSGCVWGGQMTAIRIDGNNKIKYQVACTEYGR